MIGYSSSICGGDRERGPVSPGRVGQGTESQLVRSGREEIGLLVLAESDGGGERAVESLLGVTEGEREGQ